MIVESALLVAIVQTTLGWRTGDDLQVTALIVMALALSEIAWGRR